MSLYNWAFTYLSTKQQKIDEYLEQVSATTVRLPTVEPWMLQIGQCPDPKETHNSIFTALIQVSKLQHF